MINSTAPSGQCGGGVMLYSSLIQSMDVSYEDPQEHSSPNKEGR